MFYPSCASLETTNPRFCRSHGQLDICCLQEEFDFQCCLLLVYKWSLSHLGCKFSAFSVTPDLHLERDLNRASKYGFRLAQNVFDPCAAGVGALRSETCFSVKLGTLNAGDNHISWLAVVVVSSAVLPSKFRAQKPYTAMGYDPGQTWPA